jgi:hypothetical protein
MAALGCGGAQEAQPVVPEVASSAPASSVAPAASFPEEKKLLHFHSKRFGLTLPLPDGRGWKIDDHKQIELVATHAGTSSKLVVLSFADTELVNRQACEEKARAKGLVPKVEMRQLEEAIVTSPEAYDTRIWITIEPPATPTKPLVGHVFAFGGFLRKCLFFHFQSTVPTPNDEDVLSSRLAVARIRVLGGITIDPFAEPPREKPTVPR